MERMKMFCHLPMVLIFYILLVQEVLTEYCGENIFCNPPYKCCQIKTGCCYDSMLHTNRHLRLQIWNMWYFWFFIIFMMMSCFGGCGYYRRRRLAMLTQAGQTIDRPAALTTSRREPIGRLLCRRDRRDRHADAFTYAGPGVNMPVPVTTLPPAYSEVVSDPGLYPVNKCELPPYPGDKTDNGAQSIPLASLGGPLGDQDTCLPPPYSEVPPPESVAASTHPIVNWAPVPSTDLPASTNRETESGTNE